MKTKLMAPVICSALFLSMSAQTVLDRDLQLNGHFRGTAKGYSPAPGWTLTADGGNARILPGQEPNKFRLEITAGAKRSQSVVSDLHQVFGNTIEIEADISGKGYASIGFEAFDSTGRKLVAAEKLTCQLSGTEQCFKRYFPVSNPAAKQIRVRLTAEAGSTAIFRDIEAEMKQTTAAPAQGSGAASTSGTIAAPTPADAATASAPAQAAAVPAPAQTAAVPAPPASASEGSHPMLQHHRYYPWRSLRLVEHFQVQLPVGSSIEFDLQENRSGRFHWTVDSYDARICQIKVDHDQSGIFPFRYDKAEFDLKAISRGTTSVVLTCGRKKIFVHFAAL